jgi:ABC-2 type transport system ATP-binding protein
VILTAKNLTKKFGNQIAVNGVNISIEPGCFYSLLGPNGAGKSTTIHLLSTLLKADSGEIIIDNKKVGAENEKIKPFLGIVPQEISLYEELTALENLQFWGKMYGVEKSILSERINQQLKDFGLLDRKNDKVKTYSGGMKRRINIAAALLHQPKIVFMDEPTVGIDPQSRNNIYDALQRMKNEGITILYTTHYIEEAERFSDKVGIIDNGKIIAEGTVDELKKHSKVKEEIEIHVSLLNDSEKKYLMEKYFDSVSFKNNCIKIKTENVKTDLMSVLNFCTSLSLEIEQVEIQKANLEKVFLSLTGKTLRD